MRPYQPSEAGWLNITPTEKEDTTINVRTSFSSEATAPNKTRKRMAACGLFLLGLVLALPLRRTRLVGPPAPPSC